MQCDLSPMDSATIQHIQSAKKLPTGVNDGPALATMARRLTARCVTGLLIAQPCTLLPLH